MSEHVSIETARKLAAAGLRRAQWEPGDWYAWDWPGDGGVKHLARDVQAEWLTARAAGGLQLPLFLPCAADLLQELAQRGDVTCGTWDADGKEQRWYVGPFDLTVRDEEFTTGDSLVEAVAAVLLAVLQEEGQDG